MEKLRIAYLMHGIGWGGAAGSLLLLLKSLGKESEVEKHFFTTIDRNVKVRDEFLKNVDYYNIYETPLLYNDQAGGKTCLKKFEEIKKIDHKKLIDYLNRHNIDILHINSIVLSHVIQQVKEKTKVKIVFHVRELIPKYDNGEVQNFIINTIEKYSDTIICISDNEAIPFLNHPNITILPNPFNFDVIDNINVFNLRNKYNIKKDTLLIGMGGQFSESRGHLLFLESINLLLNLNNDIEQEIKFVFFGINFNPKWKRIIKKILKKRDIGQEFLNKIRKYNLKDKIVLLPYFYTDEYFAALNEIDIYVRSSLAGDPWGRDIIEAMALGKPIIATGTSDFFVNPNINGLLVNPISAVNLSSKLKYLSLDKQLLKKFGVNSKKICYEKCDLIKYGSNIKNIYSTLRKG